MGGGGSMLLFRYSPLEDDETNYCCLEGLWAQDVRVVQGC